LKTENENKEDLYSSINYFMIRELWNYTKTMRVKNSIIDNDKSNIHTILEMGRTTLGRIISPNTFPRTGLKAAGRRLADKTGANIDVFIGCVPLQLENLKIEDWERNFEHSNLKDENTVQNSDGKKKFKVELKKNFRKIKLQNNPDIFRIYYYFLHGIKFDGNLESTMIVDTYKKLDKMCIKNLELLSDTELQEYYRILEKQIQLVCAVKIYKLEK